MDDKSMQQQLAEHRRALLVRAGLPPLHLAAVYDREPEEGEALAAVRGFLRSKDTMLLLSGATGTRKTGAAAWWLIQMAKLYDGHAAFPEVARFLPADEMNELCRFEAAAGLRKVKQVPLLVIDDLGANYDDARGFFSLGFNALMNERYAHMRSTLVTTNLTAEEFRARFPRVADRMRECGRGIELGGKSQRKHW